jgi:hypothetical protein
MAGEFQFDVFRSHSAKDKAVVRPLAERLRKDGLKAWPCPPKPPGEGGFDEWEMKPSDYTPARIEEGLERSRVLACSAEALGRRRTCPAVASLRRPMLCMSANAFGSGWSQSACPAVTSKRRRKAGTFRFRDPLN